MNAIANFTSSATLTMSSREIAELTGKEHKNVLADVRKMLSELGKTSAEFSADVPDAYGRPQTVFLLPKRETLILVSGYSVELRAKIIDRWQALEAQAAKSAPAVPQNYIEALEHLLESKKAEQAAIAERDRAVATKAEIGSRREATAMNTASQATRRAEKLQIELDRSQQWATIKRVERAFPGKHFNWRVLKQFSIDMSLPARDVPDVNYGVVKAYHADVWQKAYGIEIGQIVEVMAKAC